MTPTAMERATAHLAASGATTGDIRAYHVAAARAAFEAARGELAAFERLLVGRESELVRVSKLERQT